MGIKDTIVKAYRSIVGSKDGAAGADYDFGMLSDLDDMDGETQSRETALLSQIDPEMRNYLSTAGEKLNNVALPPRVIPVNLLTDTPTATQLLAMLGMVRWAMEKSSSTGKEVTFKVRVANRNDSPFLVGMGDVAIPRVAPQDCVDIGN